MPTTEVHPGWKAKQQEALRYLYDRDHYQEFVAVRNVLLSWPPKHWGEFARDDMAAGYALLNIVEDLYAEGLYDIDQYELAVKVLDL